VALRDAQHARSAAGAASTPVIIGIDFDNTIVSYDTLMHTVAREWGLIDQSVGPNKRDIRDAIRKSSHGELAWQRLQIAAYGTRIAEALPAEGVEDFFLRCKEEQIPVRIVSHKTVYPNLSEPKVNLRDAALGWLEQHGFVAGDAFGVAPEHVYFEATRAGKIARIASLGLTHFVDDLEETFAEPGFPASVARILYSAHDTAAAPEVTRIESWRGIRDYFWPSAKPARAGSLA
jgi:hypothetical protein